ncbi:hypothetical protein EJ02DRAFT_39856 [Clathrospora elynae]|uniref:Uncharacterized protein n=1 Tax=Clathrospora elynae TaxID=706981 RepID=A0A6A5SEC6_9PLEO|nr:hypothetical protein EJ02DRAFT_39856 [Clathrospora elynae]
MGSLSFIFGGTYTHSLMYGYMDGDTHYLYYVSHIVNHSCDTSAYSTTTRTSRTARCTSFYEASFCPSVLSSSRSTQSTLSPRAPHSYARPYASSPQRGCSVFHKDSKKMGNLLHSTVQ